MFLDVQQEDGFPNHEGSSDDSDEGFFLKESLNFNEKDSEYEFFRIEDPKKRFDGMVADMFPSPGGKRSAEDTFGTKNKKRKKTIQRKFSKPDVIGSESDFQNVSKWFCKSIKKHNKDYPIHEFADTRIMTEFRGYFNWGSHDAESGSGTFVHSDRRIGKGNFRWSETEIEDEMKMEIHFGDERYYATFVKLSYATTSQNKFLDFERKKLLELAKQACAHVMLTVKVDYKNLKVQDVRSGFAHMFLDYKNSKGPKPEAKKNLSIAYMDDGPLEDQVKIKVSWHCDDPKQSWSRFENWTAKEFSEELLKIMTALKKSKIKGQIKVRSVEVIEIGEFYATQTYRERTNWLRQCIPRLCSMPNGMRMHFITQWKHAGNVVSSDLAIRQLFLQDFFGYDAKKVFVQRDVIEVKLSRARFNSITWGDYGVVYDVPVDLERLGVIEKHWVLVGIDDRKPEDFRVEINWVQKEIQKSEIEANQSELLKLQLRPVPFVRGCDVRDVELALISAECLHSLCGSKVRHIYAPTSKVLVVTKGEIYRNERWTKIRPYSIVPFFNGRFLSFGVNGHGSAEKKNKPTSPPYITPFDIIVPDNEIFNHVRGSDKIENMHVFEFRKDYLYDNIIPGKNFIEDVLKPLVEDSKYAQTISWCRKASIDRNQYWDPSEGSVRGTSEDDDVVETLNHTDLVCPF